MRKVDICALLRGTPDAALVIDGEGLVHCLNQAAEAVFDKQLEFGKTTCTSLLQSCGNHGQSICRHDCAVRQRAAQGLTTDTFECTVQTPAGRRWFSVSTIVIPPHDGGVMIIHILREMDTRKKLELLMQRFLSQFSSLIGEKVEGVTAPAAPHLELSAREQEVLRHLAEGKGTKEIATELGLSIATVRNHTNHILRRLAVHSRTEAVLRAVRERLV